MTTIFNTVRQRRTGWDPKSFFVWTIILVNSGAASAYPTNLYFSLGHAFTKTERASYDKYRVIQKRGHEQRVAVGQVVDHFRLELEGSFYKASYQCQMISPSSSFKGIQQRISGMGNLYYDFSKPSERLNPYLGAGIGVSRIKSILKVNTTTANQTERKFSIQGIGGLRVNLSSSISMTIDGRYFFTQKSQFQGRQQKVKSINFGIMFKF